MIHKRSQILYFSNMNDKRIIGRSAFCDINFRNSILIAEPEPLLFSTPYAINIPDDRVLQLYSGEVEHVSIYLPSVSENLTLLGEDAELIGYWSLVLENQRYMFWGFIDSPKDMTETGKKLLINSVILTANVAWETTVGE